MLRRQFSDNNLRQVLSLSLNKLAGVLEAIKRKKGNKFEMGKSPVTCRKKLTQLEAAAYHLCKPWDVLAITLHFFGDEVR